MTPVYRLAIIGAGPRATYALERLSAQIGRLGAGRLVVRVFDRSGNFGAGEAHSPTQPATSYLNRIAGQVGFAADETVSDAGPLRPGPARPTLYEWCRRQFELTGHPDLDVGPRDTPKRYLHGRALQHMFDSYVEELRAHPGVEVHLHPVEVVDLEPRGATLMVRGAGGEGYPADQLLLVTGHTAHDPRRGAHTGVLAEFADRTGNAYVPYAYPLDEMLPEQATAPGTVVGLAGMGLTAIDVVLYLTEGRGGSFLPDAEHGLRYRPSGAEPARILPFSNTGLFTFTLPHNGKLDSPALEHRGVFLTFDAIDALRDSVGVPGHGGPRQLDFDAHVLPIIVLEMACLHYTTLFGRKVGGLLADHVSPAYRSFLRADAGHGDRPGDPERLLTSLEQAVDGIVATLEAVVDGRVSVFEAEADTSGWPVEATLLHWVEITFGAAAREQAADALADRSAIRQAASGWASPWRLGITPGANRFNWSRTIAPIDAPNWPDQATYRLAVLDFMERDELWACHGNLDNPTKAAVDGVWRDLRPVILYAVDDGGLTPDSHRTFRSSHLRLNNRLVNGAGLPVMARIRALARHGLLDVGTGPGAVVSADPAAGRFRVDGPATGASTLVDTLIEARIPPFDPARDSVPLYRNLLDRGIVRLWRNTSAAGESFAPGGLDLSERFHAIADTGEVDERITVLGQPAEGRKSFLLSALRPGANHYVMRDTVAWLTDFWKLLDNNPHHLKRHGDIQPSELCRISDSISPSMTGTSSADA
ncbi:FAD/NAD(P)-binding protein [Actinokineospora sp.]|uniref:FAD/NAD(P)-binding protein n=1 Tax=Actinokineospora sp. TaxID=1872133 RepID=UPI0040377825